MMDTRIGVVLGGYKADLCDNYTVFANKLHSFISGTCLQMYTELLYGLAPRFLKIVGTLPEVQFPLVAQLTLLYHAPMCQEVLYQLWELLTHLGKTTVRISIS